MFCRADYFWVHYVQLHTAGASFMTTSS
jgi:hypothetical protein